MHQFAVVSSSLVSADSRTNLSNRYLFFFQVFNRDFIMSIYTYFTHVAASDKATDDVMLLVCGSTQNRRF